MTTNPEPVVAEETPVLLIADHRDRDTHVAIQAMKAGAADFLRRAEEESEAPEETLNELRRHVLDEGTPLPKISRIYREAIFPLDSEEQTEKRLAGLASTINKLIELMAQARADRLVPEALCAEVEEPLQRLVDHLGRKAAAA